MPSPLDHLAEREVSLHAEVAALEGPPEERFPRLHAGGVFARYGQVFEEYVRIALTAPSGGGAGTPPEAREALERATFLLWYAAHEPRERTGLWRLDEEAQDEVVRELDRLAQKDGLHPELRFQLRWYHTVADYVFDSMEEGHALKAWLRETRDRSPARLEEAPEELRRTEGRGLLGIYFAEVLAGRDDT